MPGTECNIPSPPNERPDTVLVTGATGFIGRHLRPALLASGFTVRNASRRPAPKANGRAAEHWVHLDVSQPRTLGPALDGCTCAVYLVHGVGVGRDYPAQERRAAEAFVEAAARAGLMRIVYVGGVAPKGNVTSRHLESRLQTGRALRAGPVPVVELRASMIIGRGSASWQIVRDLAVRLPVMVLPRWLDHLSCPVAIDDVVAAVLVGLHGGTEPGWFEVPGPECLSHHEVLARVARLLGGKIPRIRLPPVVTLEVLCRWVALVTRVDSRLVRELLPGLKADLLPQGPPIWKEIPGYQRVSLDRAVMAAFEDETSEDIPSRQAIVRLASLARQVASELDGKTAGSEARQPIS